MTPNVSRHLAALLLGSALMATGCGTKVTQVIVTIDAEPGVRLDGARLHLVVLGGAGRTTAPTASRLDRVLTPGAADPAYPFDLALAPLDGDVGRSYSVTATAETGAGAFVGQARIIGGYVEGETTTVRLVLEDACRAIMCSDTQTCRAGACVDAHASGDFDGGVPDAGPVDAGGQDAGRDAGDAGVPGDAGDAGDAGINECDAGADDCDDDPAATCADTTTSFTCTCPAGFVGMGHGATGCRWDDPSLISLVPSVGTLDPAFAASTTMYALTLPSGAVALTVTPTITEPTRATIRVNGAAVVSGAASAEVRLSGFAPTVVTIVVTTETGTTRTYTVVVTRGRSVYVKASNAGAGDGFGGPRLSADGSTLAVAVAREGSNSTGIGGDQTNNSAADAGAVYIFTRTGALWTQQAYIKASNTNAGDIFGVAMALSADGATLAVGAYGEDSSAVGVGGDQLANGAIDAGAAYVFTRTGGVWTQRAYVKASNTGAGDRFGGAVALSPDGLTLAVGAYGEASAATGIGGDQANNGALGAGAVYVFTRTGSTWAQQAYVKASNTEAADNFGYPLGLSADGATLAVGAYGEDSSATGVGGSQVNNSALGSGAGYVFTRTGVTWTQQAYVKASNTEAGDTFGATLALSGDGSTLAVASITEDSNAVGIGGDQANNSATDAGAVFVFARTGSVWTQQAYLKASNTDPADGFGWVMSLTADGATLSIGATREDSSATGVGGDQASNTAIQSGAVYVFTRTGTVWTQQAYVKATNTEAGDGFFAVALSADGSTIAVAAVNEASSAIGIGGDETNNSAAGAGAVYVF